MTSKQSATLGWIAGALIIVLGIVGAGWAAKDLPGNAALLVFLTSLTVPVGIGLVVIMLAEAVRLLGPNR